MSEQPRTMTVPLTKGYVALVDADDYLRVSQYKWCAAVDGRGRVYAKRALPRIDGKQPHILMHRFILQTELDVDHADNDGLNNQRYNLRPATKTQNQANKVPRLNTTSKYKGVRFSKSSGRWYAVIKSGGREQHLGTFADEWDAAQAYNLKAVEVFGQFARMNRCQ